MTSPSEPPPPSGAGAQEESLGETDPPHALPLQLELPREAEAVPEEQPAAKRTRGKLDVRRLLLRLLVGLVLLGAAAAAVVAYVLPWYVRRQCIEEAAAHGITLAIDDAKIDGSGFHLLGVRATSADVPGARIRAPQVDVETTSLRPQKMTVHGAEVTLEGHWNTVDTTFAKWSASPGGGQGGAWVPVALVFEDSRIVWQAPLGENAGVEASGVHLDMTTRPAGVELHARSARVTIGVPGGSLGPWRIDLDRTPGTSRVRIALDPGVPEACTVLVVGDDERTTSVDVSVPRSPLARLGLPPQLLGLRGKDLQAEATMHYATQGPSRADATAKGGLYSIEAGLPLPLDVAWEASANGDPTAGLDVKKARLAVGPLVGAMTGTLKRFEDGFRLDLAWSAGPVPCKAFDTPLAEGQPFDIAYQLRKLAEAAGLTKVDGDVSARGTLAFDSRDLGQARVDFQPDARCQVTVFGQP